MTSFVKKTEAQVDLGGLALGFADAQQNPRLALEPSDPSRSLALWERFSGRQLSLTPTPLRQAYHRVFVSRGEVLSRQNELVHVVVYQDEAHGQAQDPGEQSREG
jgi:hypothetical protein